MPSTIALDAMGSDRAPKPEIEGALQAARHFGIRVLLVGPQDRLKSDLERYPGARRLPIEVVHASEVITMDDKAAQIIPLERLAVSPQCGFASTHEGNRLTPEEQQKKLELVAQVAKEVWG